MSDTTSPSAASTERDSLRQPVHDAAVAEKDSVLWTMKRYYLASKGLGWIATGSELLTALFGAVLIYGLRTGGIGFDVLTAVSVIIGVVALIKTIYKPQRLSKEYYQTGQRFQELFDEIKYFTEFDVRSEDQADGDLQDRLEELSAERHRLNQDSPQLSGVWYWILDRNHERVYKGVTTTEADRERLVIRQP
jgi:hypothetical protein